MSADPPPESLAEQILAGSRTGLARAITLIESSRADHRVVARALLRRLDGHAGTAIRVGISGVPGAGKSTLINTLGLRLLAAGHRVAVLAVDPSGRTGGSILGDRTRMADLAASDAAFVRPSPTGGHLGGVARATRESMLLVQAAGFDVVLVETVGVGQSETAVADMVDTLVLLVLAGAGDQLQGIKRGILERSDVIVVNKADGDRGPAARLAAQELGITTKLLAAGAETRPVVLTASALTGEGVDELWQAVLDHRAHAASGEGLEARRAGQQVDWLWSLVDSGLAEGLQRSPAVGEVRSRIEAEVAAGTMSALDGAGTLLAAFAADAEELWPAASDGRRRPLSE